MRICIGIVSLLFIFSLKAAAHEFSPVDSVGVKTVNGKKFILYKIEQLETWYRISRKYGLSVKELQEANEEVLQKPLSVGQVLLVPVDTSIKFITETIIHPGDKPIMHKVKKNETLLSVATKYGVTMRNIRIWNSLKRDNLTPGQELIVGYKGDKKKEKKKDEPGSAEPMGAPGQVKPAGEKKDTSNASEKNHPKERIKIISTDSVKPRIFKSDDTNELKAPAPKGKEIEEHGMASFIEDEDINPHKYYALHRLAPQGTIIKVTNIMNKKQIYVKVVGALPNTGDNNDLLIKMSKASAMKLGVLDSHFQVILDYYGE